MTGWGQKLAGKVGSALSTVGKATGYSDVAKAVAPNFTLASSLQNFGGNKSGQGFAWVPKANASAPATPLNKPYTAVQGAQTVQYDQDVSGLNALHQTAMQNNTSYSGGNTTPIADTSGQGTGTGDTSGGGDTGSGYDYISALRDSFSKSRSALEGILPTYDSDFANFKSSTEGGLARARDTQNTQNADDERLFGQDLRKTLQTDREMRQRRQGVFSGLNALDSSAYRDDTIKADQNLQENTSSLDAEKRRNFDSRQKEYTAYEQQANSQIASYGNEIARAKQGLQQAIASTNMDEAASIQNYIAQLDSQAQQVNQQREAMAMNMMQLQAQGTDVMGNLSKMNMGQFSNLFGQKLASQYSGQLARLSPGQQGVQGSGRIGNGTQSDELRRLYGQT